MISCQSILIIIITLLFQGTEISSTEALDGRGTLMATSGSGGFAVSVEYTPLSMAAFTGPAASPGTLPAPAADTAPAASPGTLPAPAADTAPAASPGTLPAPAADTAPAASPGTLPAPAADAFRQANDTVLVSRDTISAGNDTIPAENDTLPASQDTIPPFPAAPSPQDTLIVPPDTIPPFPAAPLPQDEDPVPAENDTIPPYPDEAPGDEPEEIREVLPWPVMDNPGYEIIQSDSTMRWFMALDWADRLHRKPGVLTYRTGRLGQPSGIDIHSFENRHQKLTLNEMDVTDPVTGQINWNRLPIHKVSTIQVDDLSYMYRSRIDLREHYTVQPMTFLNFDEGSGNYRNLEFSFTHNFTPETNLELSFWDRRDGDQFPRNNMEGQQIIAKGRHNLSDVIMVKAGFINNGFDQQQSFGYSMPELAFFHFNPYNATAREGSAESSLSTNDLYVQIFQRPDTDSPARRAAGIHYQTDAWDIEFSQDTSAYSLRDISAFAWQDISLGESTLRGRAEVYSKRDRSGRSLAAGSWLGWKTGVNGHFPLFPGITAKLRGSLEGRNDDRSGYESSAGIRLEPWNWVSVEGFAGAGSTIPDIQPLYWNSIDYQGNELLENETGFHAGVSSEFRFGPHLSLGMRADAREATDGIFLNPAGSFENIGPYTNLSMTASLDLDSPLFEGSLSATSQEFISNSVNPVNMQLEAGGERLWLKGSLYWKNYVFNRAAYVKAGLSGLYTPGNYTPSEYIVPLNRWQHGGDALSIPGFQRVDIDVAARIRWFILLMRYENVLDGVQQLGYFEADAYPMPGRRFIMGFRIVFTN